ncbi:tyrosine-type recombinase/integrase [Lichenibacterium minor]|nr:tyrosine-type recombinase/integrase [Lichenibacterium minor]
MAKMKLTDAAVSRLALAPGQTDVMIWDAELPGFGLRMRPAGRAWTIGYRPAGTGREGMFKRLKIGSPEVLKAAEARAHARTVLAQIALGADPLAERAKAKVKAATTTTLGQVLDRYETSLERRGYVNRRTVMATLRNRMAGLLKREIATVTGAELAEIIASVEAAGKPGAAKDFRTVSRAFFGWALSDARVVAVNPLAGYRKQRSTRADKVAQEEHGRALSDVELAAVWKAADPATTVGRLVRFYVLTGCRRGEGAGLTRAMLDRPALLVRLPAIFVKQARGHIVPITPALAGLFDCCIVDSRSDLLFPSSRTGGKMSGWSKMLAALQRESGVEFGFHDLRRTLRTGMSRLGVDVDTAELAIGHAREDLEKIYNRDDAIDALRSAFDKWSAHVAAVTTVSE